MKKIIQVFIVCGLFVIMGGTASGNDVMKLKATGSCVGCDLTGADLNGENLFDAKLEGTKLIRAKLEKAELGVANLKWANLEGAILCHTAMPWGEENGGCK